MSEEIKSTETMEESFEELLNQSFKTLNTGEKVTGIVTAITPTEVQVDVGAKQYAYIKLSELSDDPSAKPEDIVKVGDEVETYVVRVNDVEGYAELSKKRLDAVKVWEDIERPARRRPPSKAKSLRRTRAALLSTSRACACSCPLPSPACPAAPSSAP